MGVRYIVSRTALAVVLGGALYAGGLPWWAATCAGALAAAFFLVVRRGGRYVVEEGKSFSPLRRDERSRAIRDRAARNAFVVAVLCLGALIVVYGRILDVAIPVEVVGLVLALAVVVYAVSDLLSRRPS